MTSTLTHPEWDKETGGLEVAKAFVDQIRGKNGSHYIRDHDRLLLTSY
jgi:hypothetical protein